MKKTHTHYDNLKVARNAPPEVIKAAYKSLSQLYHPDKNPNNPEAARIMTIINTSYDVLSDPYKRQLHDNWIYEQENPNPKESVVIEQPKPEPIIVRRTTLKRIKDFLSIVLLILIKFWYVFLILIIIIVSYFNDSTTKSSGSKSYSQTPPVEIPKYTKPLVAPNGEIWPESSGYVKGYQILCTKGLSSVTVDNSGNDSDVFVKLVSLNNDQAYPVRQFFIPAFGKFTLKKVTSGIYDIRYRDLDTGNLARSESFTLEEIKTEKGTQYSDLTMTLFKVHNGNMQTYDITESEF